jgi:hypothetical protein
MSSFKIGANQPNLLTLLPLQGGRTVSAAVSVAANDVVVELMNGSFAILLFLTRKGSIRIHCLILCPVNGFLRQPYGVKYGILRVFWTKMSLHKPSTAC